MKYINIVEERREVCSVVSKLVSLKIFRRREEHSKADGEIIGFDCADSSPNCESRCTYRMLLED